MAIIGAAFPIAILVGPVLVVRIRITRAGRRSRINPGRHSGLALALIAVPHLEPGPMPRHFDVAGAAVFTTALVALILAVTWAAEQAPALPPRWRSPSASWIVAFFFMRAAGSRTHRPAPLLREPDHCCRHGLVSDHRRRAFLHHRLPADVLPDGLPVHRHRARPSPSQPCRHAVQRPAVGWLASRTGRYRIFPILEPPWSRRPW